MYTIIIFTILTLSTLLSYYLYDSLFINALISYKLKITGNYRMLFKKHFKIYIILETLYNYFILLLMYTLVPSICIYLFNILNKKDYFIIFWIISISIVVMAIINWICGYLLMHETDKDLSKCKEFVDQMVDLIKTLCEKNNIEIPTCLNFIEYQFVNHSLTDEEFKVYCDKFDEFLKENSEKLKIDIDFVFLLDAVTEYNNYAYSIKNKTVKLIDFLEEYDKNGGDCNGF